jgi:hypothetical protein
MWMIPGYINPISSFNKVENLLPSKGGNGVIEDGSKSSIAFGRLLSNKCEYTQDAYSRARTYSIVDALRCPNAFKEDATSS